VANERLAQPYAQALFEQALEQYLAPLKTIAVALEQAGVITQLDDPTLEFAQKQALVQPLWPTNTPAQVQNFVLLLASKNHMHLLNEIIADLDRYAKREALGTRAKVTTAIPLTENEKSALETKLRAQFGQDLTFDYTIDASILGGLVVRIGDKVIDGSVAGKLAALQEKLK
jgi:F-type H+-transporting ATPase subunit delta